MNELKSKARNGVIWSGLDKSFTMLVQFVFGIILARLLMPRDYGLMGMITIFITISQALVEGGFSRALIQRKDVGELAYSTVFFFNLLISLAIYAVLYLGATPIASFYDEPLLIDLVKVVGLNVIISSLAIIQRTILIKKIDFKSQAIVNIISGILGAAAGITCAIMGFGVWSLVIQYLSRNIITSLLFWYFSGWRPQMRFSWPVLRELFDFGSKILASTLLYAAFQNIYAVVIGKVYKSEELGYYTRATLFKQIPATLVTTIMQNVTFPVLVEVIEDDESTRNVLRRSIRLTAFLLLPMIAVLIVFAHPIVIVLLTEKWQPTIILLKILAIGVVFFPINAINTNFVNAKGRSDLSLKVEIFNNVITVVGILITYKLGLVAIALGYVLTSCIGFFAYAYFTGKYVNYSGIKQVLDLLPYFALSATVTLISSFVWSFVAAQWLFLVLGIGTSIVTYLSCAYFFNFKEVADIKSLILSKIKK